MPEPEFFTDADALAAAIPDNVKLAIFKDSGVPMEAARALIRRRAKGLHLVTIPTAGMIADMLIGSGCVDIVETAGVSLGEFGPAREFANAVKAGQVKIMDSTCPAIYSGIQAGEKGIPFMPMRGLIGSDILRSRDDYTVIDNPLSRDDPIVALPAIRPDISLIHVPLADRFGNLWIGRQSELKIMAHASIRTFVTAEKIVDTNIMEDEKLAAASISSLYVSGVALAERGAWPLDMPGHYTIDRNNVEEYARVSGSGDGFQAWIANNIFAKPVAAE